MVSCLTSNVALGTKKDMLIIKNLLCNIEAIKLDCLFREKKCCASFFVNHPLHIFDSLTFKKKVVKGFLCHFHSRSTEMNL